MLFYDLGASAWRLGSYDGAQFNWSDITEHLTDPDEDSGSTISKRSSTPKYDLPALISDFAPLVWLCPEDSWWGDTEDNFPSGVDWYLQRVKLYSGWSDLGKKIARADQLGADERPARKLRY
jgi:hypothetical protein